MPFKGISYITNQFGFCLAKYKFLFYNSQNQSQHNCGKKLRSEFIIFRFWSCLIHYKSPIRGSKNNCLFFVATSFYFYSKNYFCQWHLQRNRKTESQKEVEKWLAQGKVSEAKKLAKKLLSEGKILEAKKLVIMEYFKDLSYSL